MQSPRADVVLLASDGPSTRAIFHRLRETHPSIRVVLEEPVARAIMVRRRASRLGVRVVAGQLLFQSLVQRPLAWASRERITEIAQAHRLDLSAIPAKDIVRVESVNDAQGIRAICALSPRVVVLSGTRIVARRTLDAIGVTVLNLHAGITPRYRGVHGGYWALAEGRPDLMGTTIHLVDPGIDTGNVLEQVCFTPASRDNFATYPYLHLAHGLPALLRQVELALDGHIVRRSPLDDTSQLRFHPTLLQYILGGVK